MCSAECGVLTQPILAASQNGGSCQPHVHFCQDGEGECQFSTDCQLGLEPNAEHCDESCGSITQDILTSETGNGACNPVVYDCQFGDGACVEPAVDCQLGALPNPNWCNQDCAVLTQAVITSAQGAGTCSPVTYQCQSGDGQCGINETINVEDSDCELGAPVSASDCTSSCGMVIQTVTAVQTGAGTCSPGFYQCLPGDGACPHVTNVDTADDEPTDCVLGMVPSAAWCTADCGSHTQSIIIAATNGGSCEPVTYECQPGDGFCPTTSVVVSDNEPTDCVLGMEPTSSWCEEDCGSHTQSIITPATNGGACNPVTYECQPGDGFCPGSTDDDDTLFGDQGNAGEDAPTCFSINQEQYTDDECALMCLIDESSCLASGFCSCGDTSGSVSLSLAMSLAFVLLFV